MSFIDDKYTVKQQIGDAKNVSTLNLEPPDKIIENLKNENRKIRELNKKI